MAVQETEESIYITLQKAPGFGGVQQQPATGTQTPSEPEGGQGGGGFGGGNEGGQGGNGGSDGTPGTPGKNEKT